MNKTLPILFFVFSLFLTSCSKQLLVSSGARDNKPLIFNNEYKTESLKEIEESGSAFCGIPSFKKNNKNNHKNGFLFTFNGVELGKTKRILPILTMIGYTGILTFGMKRIAGEKTVQGDLLYNINNTPVYATEYKSRLGLAPSFILALPIAGILNNFTWRNSALSGASSTVSYRLINENPTVWCLWLLNVL